MGAGLKAVIERQSLTLDPVTRETLWRCCNR
ncbi:GNAT family N-acetyltransferase [Pseudomonas syringae]|nr:GNAT family N-acetyltransferase [Pseudomonas syringae]